LRTARGEWERYLPDTRKRGKSDVKQLYRSLEMMLKKTAYKHVKSAHTVLTLLNFGAKVRSFLVFASTGDTSSRPS
jgi:hypothetical protein